MTMTPNELLPIISHYADGLDPAMILGIIEIESNFETDARGRLFEKGLMQISSVCLEHLKDLGLQIHEDDLYEADQNIRAGCKYLKYLYRVLKGKVPDDELDMWVLGAYNMGIGNILSQINRFEKPLNYKTYVEKVLKAREKYREMIQNAN